MDGINRRDLIASHIRLLLRPAGYSIRSSDVPGPAIPITQLFYHLWRHPPSPLEDILPGMLTHMSVAVELPGSGDTFRVNHFDTLVCFIRSGIIAQQGGVNNKYGWPRRTRARDKDTGWGQIVWEGKHNGNIMLRKLHTLHVWHRSWFVHYGLHIAANLMLTALAYVMLDAISSIYVSVFEVGIGKGIFNEL